MCSQNFHFNLHKGFVSRSQLLCLMSSLFIILVIFLTTADAKIPKKGKKDLVSIFDKDVLADAVTLKVIAQKDEIAQMEIQELVEHYGYSIEEHKFYASDGYLAILHRISRGSYHNSSSDRGMPVLIQHGIFHTGISFLHNEEKSLPFVLVENGFDVFLSSTRGSSMNLGHKTLKGSQKAFWNFGLDEITGVEMPELIDYILYITRYPKLNYVGYSLGTTIIALTLTNKPEYNDKINRITLMAPAIYFDHASSPLLSAFDGLSPETLRKVMESGYTSNAMRTNLKNMILPSCQVALGHHFCASMFLFSFGKQYHHLNYTLLARSLSHASTMTPRILMQMMQMKKSHKLSYYDYGLQENLLKYNQPTPPECHVSNIRTPIQAFVSTEDTLTTPVDTLRALKEIGPFFVNPETAVLKDTNFTHIDYIVNAKAPKLIYRHIAEFFKTGKSSAPEE